MRSNPERISDMVEAIERIQRYAARGRPAFDADELIQTYIVHHLQIFCEAAYKVEPGFCAAHPTIPWTRIQGMRHVLVHDYFKIDTDVVWNAVTAELPKLEPLLRAILAA